MEDEEYMKLIEVLRESRRDRLDTQKRYDKYDEFYKRNGVKYRNSLLVIHNTKYHNKNKMFRAIDRFADKCDSILKNAERKFYKSTR